MAESLPRLALFGALVAAIVGLVGSLFLKRGFDVDSLMTTLLYAVPIGAILGIIVPKSIEFFTETGFLGVLALIFWLALLGFGAFWVFTGKEPIIIGIGAGLVGGIIGWFFVPNDNK